MMNDATMVGGMGWMMGGMGIFSLLVIAVLFLGVFGLIKYLRN